MISYARDSCWHGLYWEQDEVRPAYLFFYLFLRFSDRLGQWPTLKQQWCEITVVLALAFTFSLSVSLSGSLAVSLCTYAFPHLFISVTCLQNLKYEKQAALQQAVL